MRPLLISNSDKDSIFPLEGVIRTHKKVRDVYRLYGAEDKLGLQITEGAHQDTQVLRVHAFHSVAGMGGIATAFWRSSAGYGCLTEVLRRSD